MSRTIGAIGTLLALTACAGIRFGAGDDPNGMPFYVGSPALKVVTAADCAQTADVITLPGERRTIGFRPGLGSSKLSFKIANGMLTEVNSETSGAAKDAIDLANALTKIVPLSLTKGAGGCRPALAIYEIGYAGGKLTIMKPAVFSQSPDRIEAATVSDAITNGTIEIDQPSVSNQM